MTPSLKFLLLVTMPFFLGGCFATLGTPRPFESASSSSQGGNAEDNDRTAILVPREGTQGGKTAFVVDPEMAGYPIEWDMEPQIMAKGGVQTDSSSSCQENSGENHFRNIKEAVENTEPYLETTPLSHMPLSTLLAQLPRCEYDQNSGWMMGRCKKILDRYFSEVDFTNIENQKYFTRITDLENARLLAKYFRINDGLEGFNRQSELEQLQQLNIVLFEASKLSFPVKEFLSKHTPSLVDLVIGSVNTHPIVQTQATVSDPDNILGVHLHPDTADPNNSFKSTTVVVTDKLIGAHNHRHTLLHEVGHAFQKHKEDEDRNLIHQWKSIGGGSDEGFAEAFTLYFVSKKYRDRLRKSQPSIYHFIESIINNETS